MLKYTFMHTNHTTINKNEVKFARLNVSSPDP